MPENPFAGWMNRSSGDTGKSQPDTWDYYRWAGDLSWRARLFKLRQDPMYVDPEEEARKVRELEVKDTGFVPPPPPAQVIPVGGDSLDSMTPGQRAVRQAGGYGAFDPLVASTSAVANVLAPDKNDTGVWSDFRRFASDLVRSSGASAQQTAAGLSGSAIDLFTGNLGRGQDYTTRANRPELYQTPGGVGQTVGSFADDIALAITTFGAGNAALGGMAAASEAGTATGIMGRIGGYLAAGAEPTAIKLGGRFITPAATRIERAASALAAAVPAAVSVTPEVASGRMNAAEGILTVGANALAGPFSAGQWAGRMLPNILGDVAVNVGTQAVAETIPAIVPGGAEFDASQVWKNLTYGTAMGVMFGVMNAKPMQGAGERSVFGARVPEAVPPTEPIGGASGGLGNKTVKLAQETERALFGEVTLPDDATTQQATEHLMTMRNRAASDLRTIGRGEDGDVYSFSDGYRSMDAPSAGIKNAIDTERDVYANTLAARYANNPEALITALDLEVVPGEITPDNAAQVLASKIKNEWLVQPIEGKGISGVERRLAQTGLSGVVRAEGDMSPEETAATYADYRRQRAEEQATNLAPAEPTPGPGYRYTAPLESVEQGTGFVAGVPKTAAEEIPPGAFAGMEMRSQQFANAEARVQQVEQAALKLGDLKTVSELEGVDVATKLTPGSLEEQLYRAELSGLTPEEAVMYVKNNPVQQSNMALQIVSKADQLVESAKVVSEETGIPVETMLKPDSVERKLYDAEVAGVPKAEAQEAIAQQLETQPETFNLDPEQAEALLPEGAVAGEQPAPAPKRMRKRKAREVVKNEKDVPLLETLEGPPDQVESDVEYKGETARPGSTLEDDDLNKLADTLSSFTDDAWRGITLWEKGREMAKAEKIATGKYGERAREVGRQTMRTTNKKLNVVLDLFKEGRITEIYPSEHGGKYNTMETLLASLEDVPPISIRTAVHSGRDTFFKGNIEVKPTGNPNEYLVKMRMNQEARQRLLNTIEFTAKKGPDVETVEKVALNERQKKIADMNRKMYADLDEVLAETTDRNALYATRGIDAPEGVETEFFTELPSFGDDASEFGILENSGYNIEAKLTEDNLDNWRKGFKRKMEGAMKFIATNLKKAGYTEADNIKAVDIKYYILSQSGPGKWRNVGQLYVDNTMPASVRAILDDNFESIVSGNGAGKTAYTNLIEHNGNVDDAVFNDRYDQYIPEYQDAMESAAIIANKIGVQNPTEVIHYVRWESLPGTAIDKKRFIENTSLLSREPIQFDDAKAESIRLKIEPLLAKDDKAISAYASLYLFANNQQGAEAYKYILNENLMGNAKQYKINLRNLPTIRLASLTAAMFALDEGVKRIEEDETYYGLPGSTLKQLFGNGEAGVYAITSAGLFMSGVPARQKTGARQGMIARASNSVRKLIDARTSRLNDPRVSFSKMTPEQRSDQADMFMAQKHPEIKPNTPEYDQLKAQKLAEEDNAAVYGSTIGRAFDFLRKDKTAGTISAMSRLTNDINLVGAKSPFVQEYIVRPYNQAQAQIRRIVKAIEDPINGVIADYMFKYQKDAPFWDAFWALDYRLSDLELSSKSLSRPVIRDAQLEVIEEVKQQYFKKKDGTINEQKWADFNDFQDKMNIVRKEHLRTLVSKSLGINSWQLESHAAELISTKDKLDQLIGAANEGVDQTRARITQMDEAFTQLRKDSGTDGAEKAMPGYAEVRALHARALADQMRNLKKFQYEQQKVSKRLDKINHLDEMTEKSISNRYMFRVRDNKAPLVVRVEFDKETGIPSTRREYYSLSEAKEGQIDIIRGAAAKMQASSPEYIQYIKQKKVITDRLEELDAAGITTEAQYAEYNRLTNQLDTMDGLKPVSEMSDAEVFRFANDYEQLGMQATIRDMRVRRAVTAGTKAARELLDVVMSSAEPMQAQILTRTLDGGALMRPGTADIDYVKGKGNAALVDYGGSGQVIIKQGDSAPSIGELIDEIDNLIDEPIDRAQLKQLLETYYTYRDTGMNAQGQTVQTVYVDMGALRRLVEAYTDPYVPNLVKRNNWNGYYDPDGKWTTAERASYTVKSIEGMMSQIKNYNQLTAMRKSVQEATNWLDRWDIQNGLREYVAGLSMQTDRVLKGGWADTWADYEMSLRRGISFATLMTNLGSNIGNRIQGFSMATAHGLQNATTKYGVYKTNPDGTKGDIKWMPSEASARAELYKLQEKGDATWKIAEGFTAKAYFDPRTIGLGIAAIAAPQKTLEFLAKRDGYGKAALADQGIWAAIYRQSQAANLQQGGVTGSYTVREGIRTKSTGERLLNYMGALTDFVEKQNNYSSILMSGLSVQNKFGLTDADWVMMNSGQKNDAITAALEPYKQRLSEASRARELMSKDIEGLQKQIDAIGPDKSRMQERIMLEQQLASKQERQSKMATEASTLGDALTEYLVTNRGMEQGNWDPMSKAKFERIIESIPGGKLAMTMTAPILRSYNSWQAMFRTAGRTEGGALAKMGRATGPLFGAAILTTLLGGAANTAVGLGGVFFSDIAALAEMIYAYAVEEDGEKLDKVSSRQAWEDIAGTLAEKYGMDPNDAKAYVRAAWPIGQSEGLIRQKFDINVNAGAGIWDITGGGTPAQVVLGAGKNLAMAWDVISTKLSQGSMTTYDAAFAVSTAMPTSLKRITQTGLQLLVPPSAGGFGAVKVDKYGQPVYDKDQNLQQLSGIDVLRNTFVGKRWSETRSKLIMYEGGTPLYTDDDRAAWANTLARTKYVQFGESSKSAFQGGGVAEQTNAARFEKDALQLQRAISNKYREYRPQVDAAKNAINEMYKNDEQINIGDGKSMSFRKILSIVATGGVKAEEEIKGSAPDEVRKSLLSMAEDWGRSKAAADAVENYYGNSMQVTRSGDLDAPTGDIFALTKLGERFSRAYLDYLARSAGRQELNR